MCFETGLAALLNIDLWVKYSNIITALIAVTALIVAIKQLRAARKENQRALAHSAYNEYLTLCLEFPDFGYGNKNNKNHLQYTWFFSKMLFAFEQVLEVYPSDKHWKTTIKSQLKIHISHLSKSQSIARGDWSNEMNSLIAECLEE